MNEIEERDHSITDFEMFRTFRSSSISPAGQSTHGIRYWERNRGKSPIKTLKSSAALALLSFP